MYQNQYIIYKLCLAKNGVTSMGWLENISHSHFMLKTDWKHLCVNLQILATLPDIPGCPSNQVLPYIFVFLSNQHIWSSFVHPAVVEELCIGQCQQCMDHLTCIGRTLPCFLPRFPIWPINSLIGVFGFPKNKTENCNHNLVATIQNRRFLRGPSIIQHVHPDPVHPN